MKTVDTLMILLFPFLDSLPFTLPRYWMFKDKLRISFRYVVLLQLLLASANSAAFYYINLGGYAAAAQWTTLLRYTFMLIYMILGFSLIKDTFPKLMFTYLLLLAWSFFVYGNANYIESRFFWDFSGIHPYLIYNLARIVIYLITCPFLFRFFRHTIADALAINDHDMWRYLWIIPLFSTLFGMLYCTTEDVYAYASWQFLVSRYLMLFGACYVSYLALKILQNSRRRIQLEEALKYANRNLTAQKKQYEGLTSHVEEMKKARHDLRQHLAAVQSYIERDDRTGLKEYIEDDRGAELFCRDNVVNALVSYYAAQARADKIQFEARIDYPDPCPVASTDMTVLLGNLLENAVEACRRDSSRSKWIKLRIKQEGSSALLILIDNTCVLPVTFQDGTPLSSKREGPGIGTASVQEIAQRYQGEVQFEQQAGIFRVSVFLQLLQQR